MLWARLAGNARRFWNVRTGARMSRGVRGRAKCKVKLKIQLRYLLTDTHRGKHVLPRPVKIQHERDKKIFHTSCEGSFSALTVIYSIEGAAKKCREVPALQAEDAAATYHVKGKREAVVPHTGDRYLNEYCHGAAKTRAMEEEAKIWEMIEDYKRKMSLQVHYGSPPPEIDVKEETRRCNPEAPFNNPRMAANLKFRPLPLIKFPKKEAPSTRLKVTIRHFMERVRGRSPPPPPTPWYEHYKKPLYYSPDGSFIVDFVEPISSDDDLWYEEEERMIRARERKRNIMDRFWRPDGTVGVNLKKIKNMRQKLQDRKRSQEVEEKKFKVAKWLNN